MSTRWRPRPKTWKGQQWTWPVLQDAPLLKKARRIEDSEPAFKATMASLEVGDAIFVPGYHYSPTPRRTRCSALAPAHHVREMARMFGYTMQCRTVGPGVVMLWRIR